MVDDRGQVIDAASFMPAVERLGLTSKVDRRALELVVAALREEPGIRLALNISGLTVGDAAWRRAFIALLRGNREVAARLTIEITETAMLDDIGESIRFVSGLRALGCRVALDDFGAGHTSFAQLEALPIDVVKIDGSLVRALRADPGNHDFVRTVMDLTSSFGLITIAECIETAEDAATLKRHGVDCLQGHYLGRPTTERPHRPTESD
jgi:EAL domain-containing protein (putative c-di-GMP-specific phosphodiesterase class I)